MYFLRVNTIKLKYSGRSSLVCQRSVDKVLLLCITRKLAARLNTEKFTAGLATPIANDLLTMLFENVILSSKGISVPQLTASR